MISGMGDRCTSACNGLTHIINKKSTVPTVPNIPRQHPQPPQPPANKDERTKYLQGKLNHMFWQRKVVPISSISSFYPMFTMSMECCAISTYLHYVRNAALTSRPVGEWSLDWSRKAHGECAPMCGVLIRRAAVVDVHLLLCNSLYCNSIYLHSGYITHIWKNCITLLLWNIKPVVVNAFFLKF